MLRIHSFRRTFVSSSRVTQSRSHGQNKSPGFGSLVCALAIAALAHNASAAINLFTNGGSTNTWEDPNNWISGTIPGATDDVYLDSGYTVSVSSDQTIGGELQVGLTANAYGRGNPGGTATLNINSGILQVGLPIVVGQGDGSGDADSDGVINIAAGATLRQMVGRVLIGFFGHDPNTTTSGTVNINGGTFEHLANREIFHIGGNASDTSYNAGTLNLNGGLLDVHTNGIQVGAFGPGTLNINDGMVNNPFYLSIGTNGGNVNATAHVNMAGGTLVTGEFSVCENNANTCTFIQTGGTVNVTGTETGSHHVRIGRSRNTEVSATAAKGIYSISAGAINCPIGDIWVGEGNNGEMNVSGTGAVNISGGFALSLNEGNRSESTAVINQTGGTVTIASNSGRGVFFGANGSSTYNLDGGSLTTPKLTASGGGGVKRLAFNGGSLALTSSSIIPIDLSSSIGSNGATIDVQGNDIVWVPFTSGAGKLTKLGTGSLAMVNANNFQGGVHVVTGTLFASNFSGSATGSGAVTVASGATLGGAGTINGATTVSGKLAPGDAGVTGILHFGSSLTLAAGSNTDVQLTDGADFDKAIASGAASINGAIQLSVANGYTPAYGQAHRIVQSSSRSGHFATVAGHMLSTTRWLAVTYDATGVNVTAARPGDADLTMIVNFDDLLTVAQNYGLSNRVWAQGDFDGTGVVGFDDLLIVAQNYGQSAISGEVPANIAADWALALSIAPEPASLLSGVSLLALGTRRRRAANFN